MKNKRNELNKQREYKNQKIQEDLYQYEMGNELGAQIYKEKELHEAQYKKTSLNKKEIENNEIDKEENKWSPYQ